MKNNELSINDDGEEDAAPATCDASGEEIENGIDRGFLRDDLCYDHLAKCYWMKMSDGHWTALPRADVQKHLRRRIEELKKLDAKESREIIEEIVLATQSYQSVDFVGSIGGYPDGYRKMGGLRVLIKSGPTFIEPKSGDWSMLRQVLEGMFGEEQLPYIFAWIKLSLEMFHTQKWMAGQVIALCGPPCSGKTLFGEILDKLFGGKGPGKPYSYMTGDDRFTSDWFGKELLVIDDEVSKTTITAREAFAQKIKEVAVTKSRRLHKKGVEAETVAPLQRLVIMLNEGEERLRILPPMQMDIADKIMLFKINYAEMPMPTRTPVEQGAFMDCLIKNLPGFVDFLDGWEIPRKLQGNRVGIATYQNKEILAKLLNLAPEITLLRLVDQILFPKADCPPFWTGKASELDYQLKTCRISRLVREAYDVLPSTVQCGKYLGRLVNSCPNRVTSRSGRGGIQIWTIQAPVSDPDDDYEDEAEDGYPEPPAWKSWRENKGAANALLERLKLRKAEKDAARQSDSPPDQSPE